MLSPKSKILDEKFEDFTVAYVVFQMSKKKQSLQYRFRTERFSPFKPSLSQCVFLFLSGLKSNLLEILVTKTLLPGFFFPDQCNSNVLFYNGCVSPRKKISIIFSSLASPKEKSNVSVRFLLFFLGQLYSQVTSMILLETSFIADFELTILPTIMQAGLITFTKPSAK